MCGSELSASTPIGGKCPNCGASYDGNKAIDGINDRRPDPRGKQYNPYTQSPMMAPNTSIASNELLYDSHLDHFVIKSAKKEVDKDDNEDHDETFESE